MVLETRARILQELKTALEPLVLVLLKSGITSKQFVDCGKATFVKMATENFGIRGRPTNTSRVAILTGLDRREVRRLRDAQDLGEAVAGFMSKPTQVLEGWFRDADFRDQKGRPLDLPIEGEPGSFTALVTRYAPGIPPVAMLKELRAAGTIVEVDGSKLRVLKRAYLPRGLNEDQIHLWGSILHDIGATLEHNLFRTGEQNGRFERRAINLKIDRKAIPAFESFLNNEGMAFLERIDDWLSAHQTEDGDGVRAGAGLYHIQDPSKKSATRRSRRRRSPS